MKVKFLLLLIISGIIGIDISCRKWENCDELYDIEGIENIILLQRFGKSGYDLLRKDSIEFDSILLRVEFKEIKTGSNNNFFIFDKACATSPCYIRTEWDIDSIKIFSVKDSLKTDITSQFSISDDSGPGKKIENSDSNFLRQFSFGSKNFKLFFTLNTPPAKTDTFQFNFQFFDKKGRIFEKMSDQVVITP